MQYPVVNATDLPWFSGLGAIATDDARTLVGIAIECHNQLCMISTANLPAREGTNLMTILENASSLQSM